MVPLGSKARQQGEGDPFAWTPPPTHGAQQHPPGAGLKAHRPAGQQPHHQQPPKLGAKRLGTGGTPGICPVYIVLHAFRFAKVHLVMLHANLEA